MKRYWQQIIATHWPVFSPPSPFLATVRTHTSLLIRVLRLYFTCHVLASSFLPANMPSTPNQLLHQNRQTSFEKSLRLRNVIGSRTLAISSAQNPHHSTISIKESRFTLSHTLSIPLSILSIRSLCTPYSIRVVVLNRHRYLQPPAAALRPLKILLSTRTTDSIILNLQSLLP